MIQSILPNTPNILLRRNQLKRIRSDYYSETINVGDYVKIRWQKSLLPALVSYLDQKDLIEIDMFLIFLHYLLTINLFVESIYITSCLFPKF